MSVPQQTRSENSNGGLQSGLKQRHMTMIALGGVIGAGLFVGSGVVIQSAGPAALISFLVTGVLVMLVMRMLGEMACAMPTVGSFYEYARMAWADQPQTSATGRFPHRLDVLVFLGDRRRGGGRGRRLARSVLVAGRTGLDASVWR